MKQLAVVLALISLLMAVARVEPGKQILPDTFSANFPDHRVHHEQLLHNLGQKPLRDYPGDVIRGWWVGDGPKQLLVVEPTTVNLLGFFTPLEPQSELFSLLAAAGVRRVNQVSAARTLEEYRAMGAANFNLVLDPESRAAAEDLRVRLGMPEKYGSCHTAQVAGYVLEGHVPAAEVKRLLAQRPKALGLAVPGMPPSAPGMDVPGRKDPYDVLLISADGQSRVFAAYPK